MNSAAAIAGFPFLILHFSLILGLHHTRVLLRSRSILNSSFCLLH